MLMRFRVYMLVGGAIFLALAAGFAFELGRHLTRNLRLAKSGKTVTGVVIDQREQEGTDTTEYYPIVRFTAADGSEHRFTSHRPWDGHIGDSVPVRYDATDATLAQIDTYDIRSDPGFALGVGMMLAFGWLGGYLMWRGAKPRAPEAASSRASAAASSRHS